MVQFYGNSKSRSGYLADALGPALGQGLGEFTGSYFANKALDRVINNPELKNAPTSERLSSLQAALAPFGHRGQKMFQTRVGIEQQLEQEKEMKRQEEEQSVLGKLIYGKPTPEEAAELSSKLSPKTQLQYTALQNKQKAAQGKVEQDKLASELFSSGYKAIQDNDEKAFNNVISNPQTPHHVKRQLVEYKNQREARANMHSRELRQRQNLVLNAYRQQIAQIDKQMKETLNQKETKELGDKSNKLKRLRDQDLKKLVQDPNSYTALSIWNTDAQQFMPTEGDEIADNEGMEAVTSQGQEEKPKIKFDRNNPEHINKVNQALQASKGDKAKANQILAQEFSL